MNSRSQYVDIAKGVAIIAVVLLHIDFHFYDSSILPLYTLLGGLWHVAVFFLLGGFFIKEAKLTEPISFIKGKTSSLYKLILYFYIPAVLLHNMMIQIGWYDTVTDYGGKFMTMWGIPQMLKELALSVLLAGREPILGAMWFVYVLFIALCGFSIVSWIAKKITHNERQYEGIRFLTLLALCIASCSFSQLAGITIPRFSNAITAMWLIYVGYMLKNYKKLEFTNSYVMVCALLFVYHSATISGGVALNGNAYRDVVILTVSSCSALYAICYFAKRIENNVMGHFLSLCGKESFYIMGLHFVGFKMATYVLSVFGIDKSLSALMAPAGDSMLLLLFYLAFGVLFPLFFMYVFRKAKVFLLNLIHFK